MRPLSGAAVTALTLLGLPQQIEAETKFLLVDSEAAATAAKALLPSYCVLWPSLPACQGMLTVEAWLPLQGCPVLLWPSNTAGARQAMVMAGNALLRVTDRVRMIYVNGGDPDGWSATDAAGWTTTQVVEWAKARARDYTKEVPPDPMQEIRESEADLSGEVPRTPATPTEPVQHFTDTDMANAARLVRRHGENIRYASEGKWLVWEGKRWIIDDKAVRIQGLAKDTAQGIYDEIKTASEPKAMFTHARKSQSKGALEAMATVARDAVLCSLSNFDTDPWLLNARNGTIDLRTGMIRAHARGDHLTKIVEIDYDPAADCDLWDQFLQYITALDEDLYGYLRRLIGYSLTGDTSEQVLHFLFGIGANGKSVFCEVLAELMGDYAIIVSPEMIMQKRHQGIPNDIARLRGIRLAMMNETSQGAHFDEQKLKDLTGSDKLTGRFLHAEFFDFMPTHKLIIRGNHKPVISGTDEGIWRRLRLVPFAVNIPSDEQDKLLINKLRAELPGILKWAVQGCLEWQRDGLQPPAVIMDAVKEYRQESDTLGRFIQECCETRKNAQVKSSAFFQRYQDFAATGGERWMPSKDLPHEMRRRGFGWVKTKTGNIFEGLELLQSAPVQQDWRDR